MIVKPLLDWAQHAGIIADDKHLRALTFARIDKLKESLGNWCPGTELNCRHRDFQSRALPTELPGRRTRRLTAGQWKALGYRNSTPPCPDAEAAGFLFAINAFPRLRRATANCSREERRPHPRPPSRGSSTGLRTSDAGQRRRNGASRTAETVAPRASSRSGKVRVRRRRFCDRSWVKYRDSERAAQPASGRIEPAEMDREPFSGEKRHRLI